MDKSELQAAWVVLTSFLWPMCLLATTTRQHVGSNVMPCPPPKPAMAPGSRRILEQKERKPEGGSPGQEVGADDVAASGCAGSRLVQATKALCSMLGGAGAKQQAEEGGKEGPARSARPVDPICTFKPEVSSLVCMLKGQRCLFLLAFIMWHVEHAST